MQINLSLLPTQQTPSPHLLIHKTSDRPPLTSRASHPGVPSGHPDSFDRSNIFPFISFRSPAPFLVVFVSFPKPFTIPLLRLFLFVLLPSFTAWDCRVPGPSLWMWLSQAAFALGVPERTVSGSPSYLFLFICLTFHNLYLSSLHHNIQTLVPTFRTQLSCPTLIILWSGEKLIMERRGRSFPPRSPHLFLPLVEKHTRQSHIH